MKPGTGPDGRKRLRIPVLVAIFFVGSVHDNTTLGTNPETHTLMVTL